jgi:hypothetical protein
LAQIHGSAGALLPVAQRGVEYNDSVLFHNLVLSVLWIQSAPQSFRGNKKPHRRVWRWGLKNQSTKSNLYRRPAQPQRD